MAFMLLWPGTVAVGGRGSGGRWLRSTSALQVSIYPSALVSENSAKEPEKRN